VRRPAKNCGGRPAKQSHVCRNIFPGEWVLSKTVVRRHNTSDGCDLEFASLRTARLTQDLKWRVEGNGGLL
jgi:hypothetical protein